MIKGETIILIDKVNTGVDPFGTATYTESEISVDNVIIGSPNLDSVVSDLQLYGKKLTYILGIPKGDAHDWTDKEVIIRGERFRTYGFPLTQTPENVPGKWNTQVKVEKYG